MQIRKKGDEFFFKSSPRKLVSQSQPNFRFGLIWFSSFRGKDLNVIFYQNMSNLYNQYKSVERKNSQKNPE
jgi:hypothetical protein